MHPVPRIRERAENGRGLSEMENSTVLLHDSAEGKLGDNKLPFFFFFPLQIAKDLSRTRRFRFEIFLPWGHEVCRWRALSTPVTPQSCEMVLQAAGNALAAGFDFANSRYSLILRISRRISRVERRLPNIRSFYTDAYHVSFRDLPYL